MSLEINNRKLGWSKVGSGQYQIWVGTKGYKEPLDLEKMWVGSGQNLGRGLWILSKLGSGWDQIWIG